MANRNTSLRQGQAAEVIVRQDLDDFDLFLS